MSTRITTLMLSRGVLTDVGAASQRLARTQQKLASGKELSLPSHNPTAVARAIELRTAMEGARQHQRTAAEARGWADVSDSALATITSALQRARDLAIQGANGTLSASDREALRHEVTGLIDAAKQAANASYGGRYVFGGTRTDVPPYSAASDVYGGNTDPIAREIGPGVTVQVNVHGREVLGDGATGLLATLRAVESHLAGDDAAGLATDIDALAERLGDLNAVRAKVGAIGSRLDVAESRLAEYEGTTLQLLSETEDADIAKAMIDFSVQQSALQAGLRAGANIVQNSLLDFLR